MNTKSKNMILKYNIVISSYYINYVYCTLFTQHLINKTTFPINGREYNQYLFVLKYTEKYILEKIAHHGGSIDIYVILL